MRTHCRTVRLIAFLLASLILTQCRLVLTECEWNDLSCHPELLASRVRASTGTAATWLDYDPWSVSGLRFWVRAESLALPDGSAANSWTDLSGTGNSLTSGTPPTYHSTTTAINGRPVVRFVSASSHSMVKAAPTGLSGSDSGSFFAVMRLNNIANMELVSIGELLFYDSRVSDANATNIECYLGARYGTLTCANP